MNEHDARALFGPTNEKAPSRAPDDAGAPNDGPALVREAVRLSGLSSRQFAEWILARGERSLRNWMTGANEIPPPAVEALRFWIALSPRRRQRVVELLRRK